MANNKKQFGVWMDGISAFVIGKENLSDGDFKLIAEVGGEKAPFNSNENTGNNHQQTLEQKFFKEIASHMQNAEEIHITGPGKIQDQFANYLSDVAQFKKAETSTCTSNKMNEEQMLEFFGEHFTA